MMTTILITIYLTGLAICAFSLFLSIESGNLPDELIDSPSRRFWAALTCLILLLLWPLVAAYMFITGGRPEQ